MKLNRSTYFSFFFLFSFLASFSSNAYRNLNSVCSKSHSGTNKSISVSTKEANSSTTNDFLFEENESETENDFHAQIFLLPFFISCFQHELVQSKLISTRPLAEKQTNQIYIAVCNFRI